MKRTDTSLKKKYVYLTPKENEIIVASEFIVLKNGEMLDDLFRMKSPPNSLRGKIFVIAPDGIMFAKQEVLEEALNYQKSKNWYLII